MSAQAVAAAPADARAHDMQGTVLRAAGRLDEAIASYERALAHGPGQGGEHLAESGGYAPGGGPHDGRDGCVPPVPRLDPSL